jgi:hypothetical protein
VSDTAAPARRKRSIKDPEAGNQVIAKGVPPEVVDQLEEQNLLDTARAKIRELRGGDAEAQAWLDEQGITREMVEAGGPIAAPSDDVGTSDNPPSDEPVDGAAEGVDPDVEVSEADMGRTVDGAPQPLARHVRRGVTIALGEAIKVQVAKVHWVDVDADGGEVTLEFEPLGSDERAIEPCTLDADDPVHVVDWGEVEVVQDHDGQLGMDTGDTPKITNEVLGIRPSKAELQFGKPKKVATDHDWQPGQTMAVVSVGVVGPVTVGGEVREHPVDFLETLVWPGNAGIKPGEAIVALGELETRPKYTRGVVDTMMRLAEDLLDGEAFESNVDFLVALREKAYDRYRIADDAREAQVGTPDHAEPDDDFHDVAKSLQDEEIEAAAASTVEPLDQAEAAARLQRDADELGEPLVEDDFLGDGPPRRAEPRRRSIEDLDDAALAARIKELRDRVAALDDPSPEGMRQLEELDAELTPLEALQERRQQPGPSEPSSAVAGPESSTPAAVGDAGEGADPPADDEVEEW